MKLSDLDYARLETKTLNKFEFNEVLSSLTNFIDLVFI